MKHFLFFSLFILSCLHLSSQTAKSQHAETKVQEDEPYLIATKMPEYPGGSDSMIAFIQDNLDYPIAEKKNNIQGTITVQFIVEKDGNLSNIKTVKSVPGGDNLNKEAERVVKLMPKWVPGVQDGKKVRVYKSVPFYFVLAKRNTGGNK